MILIFVHETVVEYNTEIIEQFSPGQFCGNSLFSKLVFLLVAVIRVLFNDASGSSCSIMLGETNSNRIPEVVKICLSAQI